MQNMEQTERQLVEQLVETSVPAEVDLIDRKLAVLAKHKK